MNFNERRRERYARRSYRHSQEEMIDIAFALVCTLLLFAAAIGFCHVMSAMLG